MRSLGDAVADLIELAELLDVDVDELAGLLALISAGGSASSKALSLLSPKRLSTRLTGAGETPTAVATSLPGMR